MKHNIVGVALPAASRPLLWLRGSRRPLSLAHDFNSFLWFVSILRGKKNHVR